MDPGTRLQAQVPGPQLAGNFGVVRRATLAKSGDSIDVAVKICISDSPDAKKIFETLVEEEWLALKAIGSNDNVIKAIGLVTDSSPPMLLLELIIGSNFYDLISNTQLPEQKKLLILCDFAAGLEYVHNQDYVHRDVAARNCLVNTETGQAKISDFGLAKKLDEHGRFEGEVKDIPIKWTAIETLKSGVWTKLSDIWSLGVVVFEAFVKPCSEPYFEIVATDLKEAMINFLDGGNRLELSADEAKPPVIEVMKKCFGDEKTRPSLQEIKDIFNRLITDHAASPIQKAPPKKDDVSEDSDENNKQVSVN